MNPPPPERLSDTAAIGVTWSAPEVPRIAGVTESNAVTVCGPAVFRTALNVCVPPSAVVNV